MGTGLGVPSLAHNVALGATTVTITPAAGFVIESDASTVDAASGGNRRYGNCDRARERECACHAGPERAGLDASVCPSMPVGEFQYSAM